MGGASLFQWDKNLSLSSSSAATTTPSNSFAALSSLGDNGNKFVDRDRDRDRNNGGRNNNNNKNSYNKNSTERERYGMNSRSGSSQASRENSTTRGSGGGEGGRSLTQAARSMGQMNNNNNFSSSSSATKSSASHNKFTSLQQNIPGTRGMPTKTSSATYASINSSASSASNTTATTGVGSSSSSNLGRNSSSAVNMRPPSTPPKAVFEKPDDNEQKLIKVVVTDIIENAANARKLNDYSSDVILCLKRIPDNLYCGMIYFILTDYLHLKEVNHHTRRLLAQSLIYLIKNNYLSMEHLRLAYEQFSEEASDLIYDIPQLWLYVFEFLGPFLCKKMLTVSDLWCDKLREDFGKKFLQTLLQYCTREIGPLFTQHMWRESQNKLKWTDFMDESDVEDFIKSNHFEYVEKDDVSPYIEKDLSEKHIKHVVERIEYFLKEEANLDEIMDYINGNIAEVDKNFIRRLTLTLCNYAILYDNKSYKLDEKRFQKICIPIFQRYIDGVQERELECLYAMQLLVHEFEHPRGLLSELFAELYDSDVIPSDSFHKWRKVKDQSAGKGVAVIGLNQFFKQVLSTDAES